MHSPSAIELFSNGYVEARTIWIRRLSGKDVAFLKRFTLVSGSLKKVAQQHDISYPTVRLKLHQLIQKIEIFDSQIEMSGFERQLRAAHVDGKFDQTTFERLPGAQ